MPSTKGTRIAVRPVAGCYQLGLTAVETLQSSPHFTQSQVHAALTCYCNHQKERDRAPQRNADVNYWRKQILQGEPLAA